MRSWIWICVVVATACSSTYETDGARSTDKDLSVADLHAMLGDRERSAVIEKIIIWPHEREAARYVVTMKNSSGRRVVRAPFPDPLVEEIFNAQIMYAVQTGNRDESGRSHELDATTFRLMLQHPEDAAEIRHVRAERSPGLGAAKYVVTRRSNTVPYVVYAEYPGEIVGAIRAAGIAYTESE